MVSGTSVKITNVSQVGHESQDCLATAVKKKKKKILAACVVTEKLILPPPSGGLLLHAGDEPVLKMIEGSLLKITAVQ